MRRKHLVLFTATLAFLASVAFITPWVRANVTTVSSSWDSSGNLVFYDSAGNEILHFDGANRKLVIPSGSTLQNSGTSLQSGLTANRLVGTDGSKNLASNASMTSDCIPKSASSGASLACSGISDSGTAVTSTNPLQITPTTAASPAASNLNGQGGTGSNVAGGSILVGPGAGTGNGAGASYGIQRNIMGASGSSAQAQADAYRVCESKTLSNTTGQLTTLAQIGAASNSAGSLDADISVACNDGTNFDSDHIRCTQAWVNKAGAITFGTPQCSSSVAANNSGSCTIGATITATGGNTINVNVTPVITTIVPTTTTGTITILNHGPGAITCL